MHSTQNKDDDAEMLAGVPASSQARRSGQTVILSFQADRRRYLGLEDAMEPDEGFEPLGSIAVRLVATWSRPRVVCWRQGEEPAASAEEIRGWDLLRGE